MFLSRAYTLSPLVLTMTLFTSRTIDVPEDHAKQKCSMERTSVSEAPNLASIFGQRKPLRQNVRVVLTANYSRSLKFHQPLFTQTLGKYPSL